MNLIQVLKHIWTRRAALGKFYMEAQATQLLDDSCVPSYCHHNIAASAVAWWRLLVAVRFYEKYSIKGSVLDFGASTGELLRLLEDDYHSYHFIEHNELLCSRLISEHGFAVREDLSSMRPGGFNAIFCLDSLEHNFNVPDILDRLRDVLHSEGVLIVSGPTENSLYRLGRRIAGFDGSYHTTNIFEIEKALARHFSLIEKVVGPLILPLFSISAWRRSKDV